MSEDKKQSRVAIVTCTHVYNYGNSLQNYALQQVIESYGYKAETMVTDFIPLKRQIITKIKALVKKIIKKNDYVERRKNKFQEFEKEYIRFSKYKDIYHKSKRVTDKYKYFVAGSDQIWNPSWYDDRRKVAFLLDFVTDNSKKIAYAPSFGIKTLMKEWLECFKRNLETFASISVRENEGAEIIRQLIGKDVPVLLDPTFLLDSQKWVRIQSKPSIIESDDEYILIYFLGGANNQIQSQINKIAKEYKLKVINILDANNSLMSQVGPSEFLYLINNAKIVMTDSFHACAFSFIFEKPFLVYERLGTEADMFGRIQNMLETFKLERKIVKDTIKTDIFETDYSYGFSVLEYEKNKAHVFLCSSLE